MAWFGALLFFLDSVTLLRIKKIDRFYKCEMQNFGIIILQSPAAPFVHLYSIVIIVRILISIITDPLRMNHASASIVFYLQFKNRQCLTSDLERNMTIITIYAINK